MVLDSVIHVISLFSDIKQNMEKLPSQHTPAEPSLVCHNYKVTGYLNMSKSVPRIEKYFQIVWIPVPGAGEVMFA
jgi:hypothetical protein